MENPRGRILSFVHDELGSRAVVEVDPRAVCPRCAEGKGCGAGLFFGNSLNRNIEASAPTDLNLSEGDAVEIELRPDDLLHAALSVYGLPMFSALAAVAVAYVFALDDIAAACAALVGLLLGIAAARRQLARRGCLRRFVPTISRRLPNVRTRG